MAWTVGAHENTLENSDAEESRHVWDVLEPFIVNEEDRELLLDTFKHANEDDLKRSLASSVIDPQQSNWGGHGRVTLSGDAAHAQRPTGGLGGSMAFEDSLVLVREIEAQAAHSGEQDANNAGEERNEDSSTHLTPAKAKLVVKNFQEKRLPRVVRVWNDNRDRTEEMIKTGNLPPMTDEFLEWLNAGV